MKVAVVFGYSEQGVNLAKRTIHSFINNVSIDFTKYKVDFYPYKCNFKIIDLKQFSKELSHQEIPFDITNYSYEEFSVEPNWNNLFCGNGKITTKECHLEDFQKYPLPDVAVYHDFATKYAKNYDYVLYCHNDLIFKNSPTGSLNRWTEILSYDSKYVIISELRATANFDLSIRFHLCFVFTNTQKFQESRLSFINDLTLMNGNDFYIYSNGGSGLVASLYHKFSNKPRWKPYILDTHGYLRGKGITDEDKWFRHIGEIEWNRHKSISEFSTDQHTAYGYREAKKYVETQIL